MTSLVEEKDERILSENVATEEEIGKPPADVADGGAEALAPAPEDSTTSTQYDDDADSSSAQEDDVPLLKYARLETAATTMSSPNSNTSNITKTSCSQLGRIRLPLTDDNAVARSPESSVIGPVLLTGHTDGSVTFAHIETGHAMVDSKLLQVAENLKDNTSPIVDVSLDASANYLTAINKAGMCAIWEVKYGTITSNEPAASGQQPPQQQESNPFTSLLTSLAGQPAPYNNNGGSGSTTDGTSSSASSKSTTVQVSRIHYPPSGGGIPTCLVMDPSYKLRREKAHLVGFSNGRLVLTKRGTFFLQRPQNVVIYQNGSSGIESVTWRGALVAWADSSGIKLFDVESMSRIAHVDRPTGANPSLYPTIASLSPSLCFETSDSLLVAWGDCVMTMHISETIGPKNTDESGAATPTEMGSTTIVKRRQLECSMAWELDCVACGVTPLDKDHLLVLGLVPSDDYDDASGNEPSTKNDVELQIISRTAGSVTYADVIPMVRIDAESQEVSTTITQESANDYQLLSSFSIPRMEDAVEAEEEGTSPEQQDFDFNLFSTDSANKNVNFMDSHLRWSLNSIDFDSSEPTEEEAKADDDSDDYGFVLRASSNAESEEDHSAGSVAAPIIMAIAPSDLVVVRTRDVDDAVSHALSLNKVALALQRALRHKRQLRKHDMNNLVDAFLRALLCIGGEDSTPKQHLSIRRLEIAAKSTTVLLGGSVQRWTHWVNEFARIPGALFVLWDQLPVRDPKLPPELYAEVLNSIFKQVEAMLAPQEGSVDIDESKAVSPDVIVQAVERFISALSAWGPTQALRERISFYKYFSEKQRKVVTDSLGKIDDALQRRLTQSATGYLELSSMQASSTPVTNSSTTISSTSDSLFPLEEFTSMLSSRVPILVGSQSKQYDALPPSQTNSEVALAALAEVHIMTSNYKMALKCYLIIGSLFSQEPLNKIEEKAVTLVNNGGSEDNKSETIRPYDFVIAMLEHHHLHGDLLESELLSSRDDTEELSPPLISLVRLLGLEIVGNFLVEHCVPPPRNIHYSSNTSGASSVDSTGSDISRATREGDETLPINYVAEQFRTSPSLLHWYLHLILKRKPEMYVQFPSTQVPPRGVTQLHRTHLDLYIEFAEDKDSSLSLLGTEVYNQERKTTPLLLFLKAALPLGGIQTSEVRRLLESKRSESNQDVAQFPRSFALELAYVVEHYGDGSEEDAHQVLDLYLKGAKSVMLAAAFAQRNTEFASVLWEALIRYCLVGGKMADDFDLLGEDSQVDGTFFGSLLEAAALVGADLALLVTSIPPGMNIEGLRPRLVATVADYRMKLTMHEASAETGAKDRVALLRELGHRARRGARHSSSIAADLVPDSTEDSKVALQSTTIAGITRHTTVSRPAQRPNRYRLSVQLPMR